MNFTRISSSTSLFYNRTWNERVAWACVYSVEGILIFAGNTLALVIFLQPSFVSKKSIYFVISLTVADLITGVTVMLAVNSISKVNEEKGLATIEIVQLWFDIFSGCASIYSLTAIAIERFCAIFWPFKQRLVKTRTYLISIGAVWFLSLSIPSVTILHTICCPGDESLQIAIGYFMMCFGLSCIGTVVLSYLSIWIKISYCNRQIQPDLANRRIKRLTTTLLLVTLVSVATLVPNFVILIVQVICPTCLSSLFPRQYYAIANFLFYANSFANFIIYTCRMREFRSEIAKIFCKCVNVLHFFRKCQRNVNPELNHDSNASTVSQTQPTLIGMKVLHIY
ncbi:neuromedin-K receptor-like [Actinia tenebrosa]|uniref:Neuromedin-K receptor-like n=1 Tax=Actinia tenebrosa TaxID=6105 RepID=A0A6P8I064_ACTTE|nr:neuromedin-K receptor-like [Actinia tenebrosa]